jgi:hypothetical protein
VFPTDRFCHAADDAKNWRWHSLTTVVRRRRGLDYTNDLARIWALQPTECSDGLRDPIGLDNQHGPFRGENEPLCHG